MFRDDGLADTDGIVTDSLSELEMSQEVVQATQDAWKCLLRKAPNKEAASEAIYAAFFNSSMSTQLLFTTPKAVMSMKFLLGLDSIVNNLGSKKFGALVESLGFQHLHLEVTATRVAIFRNAFHDLMEVEMGDEYTENAREGIRSMMNYVGGAFVYIRTHYAERLKLLAVSWAAANEKALEAANEAKLDASSFDENSSTGKKESGSGEVKGREAGKEEAKMGGQTMPQTFEDMFKMNMAVMGISNAGWMLEVVDQFGHVVTFVNNSNRLKEICDVLSLKLAVYDDKEIKLGDFKSCMLAALRSLLPKQWTTTHEVAWSWLWDNVARMLEVNLGKPAQQGAAMDAYLQDLQEDVFFDIRAEIYLRFFELAPAGQEYFKQSNTRLHFIAERIFVMVAEIYNEPRRMVKEISALGLRHVGFGIPTDLFGPFVTACCDVLGTRLMTQDQSLVLEAFRFALGLISKILVRTITEGSTVVMKAINANSTKQLKKAIGSAPRAERAMWCLLVQVGAQSISPLAWAIESGKMEVAEAILTDLLTIRADRSRYYYGVKELFSRHNDIIKRICLEAPMLLITLLEGLVWRSHRPKNGLRRVNYYCEHFLINHKGEFSEGLKFVCNLGDPAIMAEPIVVMVTDTLWTGIIYRQFLYSKLWNIVGLVVFELAQGVLPRVSPDGSLNILIFAGKIFTYVFGMGGLAYQIFAGMYRWSRKELKRIFEEIDTDGSGEIDWEELLAGLGMFRDLIKEKILGVMNMLKDDGAVARVDESKKAGASKKNSKKFVDLLLFGTLVAMCSHEPMWWCSDAPDFPTNECEESEKYYKWYSIFVMCSMAAHWLVLMDLAVFSTDLSSFLLVIGHVLQEVRQFLSALCFLLLLFGSCICILCRRCTDEGGDFSDMPNAVTSLLAITIRLYQGDFRDMEENPLLLTAVLTCTAFSAVLLLNLLVAQLNLSYEYIYRDMLGFARLNRAGLICEAMNLCARSKWNKFKLSLKLDTKLEFDEGDVGVPGGVQRVEPVSFRHVPEETIRRYGGPTSEKAPWPEDKNEEGEDRFERLENVLHQAVKQLIKGAQSSGRLTTMGKSLSLGSSGTGTGSGNSGGDDSDSNLGSSEE